LYLVLLTKQGNFKPPLYGRFFYEKDGRHVFLKMINVSDLTFEIGGKLLLKQVSFTLSKKQRVGLVGRNGQGKTTLLKILSGQTEYSSGTIQIAKDFRVAYLPQEVITPAKVSNSIYKEAERAFSRLFRKKERLEAIAKKLERADGSQPDHKALLSEHDRLVDELNHSGFYQIKGKIQAVLTGLGFSKEQLHMPVSSLSGGWIMRLELAKILLSEPALILLDEPTNHLDLPSLTWLENFLANQDAGCLIVSHDRAFLDKVVKQIWELDQGRLTIYKGNYSFYEKERQKRMEQEAAAWKNQQKRIGQIKQFISRFRSKATKAKQVQSRIKQLEKMELVEEPILDQIYSFRLPTPPRSGKVVVETKDLAKSYGRLQLFSGLSFILKRGEKMAIVGPNGAGKSTLLKILAGREHADDGKVLTGHNVKTAYFAQHQALELDHERSILENLGHRCPALSETRLRTIAGTFMFSEDDVHKKVAVLSGGEKSRVALAAIMATGANLLLLDEPTNHLDMASQEAVRRALSAFEGSVIVVSHNRYFLDGFIDRVLELDRGKACLYPGNLSQLLATKEYGIDGYNYGSLTTKRPDSSLKTVDNGSDPNKITRREKKRLLAQLRQKKSKKLTPLKEQAAKLEDQIDILEQEKEKIETMLADVATYANQDKAAQLNRRYRQVKKELEGLYLDWERHCSAIEEMHEKFEKKIMEIETQ